MKRFLCFFLLGFAEYFTFAQSYNTALGLRVGSGIGMSLKQRVYDKVSVEGIAQRRLGEEASTTVTGLVARHYYLRGRAINGYFGLGGHKTWQKDSLSLLGLDGIIGIEGTLFNLNTSVDYKPIYNFQNGENYFSNQFAISFRYVVKYAPYRKRKKGEKPNYPQEKWT